MHFEVLVEDESGCIAVGILLGKLLGPKGLHHNWRMHAYKGMGGIPKDLRGRTDPAKRILLDRLPALLRGYGKSLDDSSAVIVVVDLDSRNCIEFKRKLLEILESCDPRPTTLFRIAIEEIEAWLLGDRDAVMAAYPRAKRGVLDSYVQDDICGTWEVLAAAVHSGGLAQIKEAGWPASGNAKCEWAQKIAPNMDLERNRSPSFRAFRDGVRRLAAGC